MLLKNAACNNSRRVLIAFSVQVGRHLDKVGESLSVNDLHYRPKVTFIIVGPDSLNNSD